MRWNPMRDTVDEMGDDGVQKKKKTGLKSWHWLESNCVRIEKWDRKLLIFSTGQEGGTFLLGGRGA